MMKKVFCAALCLFAALAVAACADRGPANTVFSAEDAKGKAIGVLAGSSALPYAAALGETSVYTSPPQLMDALKSGALDCVIMEEEPGDKLARRTPGVKKLSKPLLEVDLCFAIAKENADLTRDVNAALAALRDGGVLSGLFDKYLKGGDYSYSPQPVNTDGTLILAVPGNFPPYSYKNEDDEYAGFDIDAARAVCAILGVELNIIEAEMPELITTVQFGKADFALGGIHENDEDGGLVDFSAPYTRLVQVILVRS